MKEVSIKILLAVFVSAFFVACTATGESVDGDDELESLSSVESSGAKAGSIYDAVEESGLYTTRDSVAA